MWEFQSGEYTVCLSICARCVRQQGQQMEMSCGYHGGQSPDHSHSVRRPSCLCGYVCEVGREGGVLECKRGIFAHEYFMCIYIFYITCLSIILYLWHLKKAIHSAVLG